MAAGPDVERFSVDKISCLLRLRAIERFTATVTTTP